MHSLYTFVSSVVDAFKSFNHKGHNVTRLGWRFGRRDGGATNEKLGCTSD
jgi:hypothetical protein